MQKKWKHIRNCDSILIVHHHEMVGPLSAGLAVSGDRERRSCRGGKKKKFFKSHVGITSTNRIVDVHK